MSTGRPSAYDHVGVCDERHGSQHEVLGGVEENRQDRHRAHRADEQWHHGPLHLLRIGGHCGSDHSGESRDEHPCYSSNGEAGTGMSGSPYQIMPPQTVASCKSPTSNGGTSSPDTIPKSGNAEVRSLFKARVCLLAVIVFRETKYTVMHMTAAELRPDTCAHA